MARLLAVFVLVALIAGISAAPYGKGLALLDTHTLTNSCMLYFFPGQMSAYCIVTFI